MPTGTGKTETMVAISVHEMPTRVFVVVPSDVLRTQLADKFQTLGLLKELGVCGTSCLYPVVGVLKHRLKTLADLKGLLAACNVIISTMALVSRFSQEEQELCASACTHLFVDEAHHIRATTWEGFRNAFKERRVLQFTATPFRNDGQHVDGRVIFNYPLRKAQEEGYFTPIRLRPVFEFDPEEEDWVIASTAIKQLVDDVAAGHDHLLMARTATILSAEALFAIYESLGKNFHPQLIHSRLSPSERRQRTKALRERHARIAICVDMFGEGFDLPELKIAALHDAHKSLAVTLQFTGRFARTKGTIGHATVVVNLADPNVDDSLRELYAEGSDWNHVLRTLSEEATGEHSDKQQFLEEFSSERAVVPTQNLTPTLSAIVYRTHCNNWKPHLLADSVAEDVLVSGPSINSKRHVAYIVTKERSSIDWGEIREFVDTVYELCLLYWDKNRNLLFIYSSNKEASHETLAKLVAGEDVELIKGSTVFRVFSGLKRLLLQTVGLSHAVGRLIRFTMLVGADIHAGLAEGQTQTKVKTNVFASGFADGAYVTVGCSRKGRIWSRQSAEGLLHWVAWCQGIGTKLLDVGFSEESILKNSIVPEDISTRPVLVPLVIEWPTTFYALDDADLSVDFGRGTVPLYRVGLKLLTHDETSPILFSVFSEEDASEYELRYTPTGAQYVLVSGPAVVIGIGRRKKPLAELFTTEPPIVRFEQDSFTEDNQLCRPSVPRLRAFDAAKIEVWDWSGTDLSSESQTEAKLSTSIQYRVIQYLKSASSPSEYDIIFDDDAAGEAADIIGLALRGDTLRVDFYHCKFSTGDAPGARVSDLYVLCGQAQLTLQWRTQIPFMLSHLMHRDVDRVKKGKPSRFEKGDRRLLLKMQRKARKLRLESEVTIVQPGLKKSAVSARQLELLGATELYLLETYQLPLRVIGSG
jgi:superfamily II DNA or RNA helicase